MEKMTYVMALDSAIACSALSDEVREKLTALREQQAKRNSAEKKPTKTQQANELLKDKVLALLKGSEHPLTVSEVLALADDPALTSNQKVASLLRLLKDEGKVERLEEKRKAYFRAL
jgi:transcriptional regulator of heat shock response